MPSLCKDMMFVLPDVLMQMGFHEIQCIGFSIECDTLSLPPYFFWTVNP